MASEKIRDGIYSVGALNPALRIFDVVMKTEFGTSYNSYIIKGEQKTALVETCHLSFFEQYVSNIEEVCALSDIDYIILNHCEPDHSGVLARLMELCPKAQVLLSQAGSIYIKNIANSKSLPLKIVKDGETLELGGRELRFINAPFLHWPDSMFTWSEADKLLFSCDFLGAHYCEPYVFDSKMTYKNKYKAAFEGYYKAIFSPFKPYVMRGLEKIKDLDIDFVCTSHGPVLTKNGMLAYTMEKYREWSEEKPREKLLFPVFYCSAYGNTGLLAKEIQKGILAVHPEAEAKVYDLNEQDMADMQALLNSCDAFAVGSPTINADAVPPVWQLLAGADAINCKKKPALVFGSYGWSGEGIPNIAARLQGLKIKLFEVFVKVQFVPDENDLAEARKTAEEFIAWSMG